jgi:hypothetical protein
LPGQQADLARELAGAGVRDVLIHAVSAVNDLDPARQHDDERGLRATGLKNFVPDLGLPLVAEAVEMIDLSGGQRGKGLPNEVLGLTAHIG